jgi:prepilin-type N-terminal cleavage/methylation domain-containing protein
MRRDESGLTLIELLITMTLLLVAVAVAGDGLFNLGRSSASAQLHSFSLAQNRVGMERLTQYLRQATYPPDTTDTNKSSHPIITHIDPMGITFTSRAGGSSAIDRFTVDISGTTLRIGRSTCTLSAGVCTWSTPTMRQLITNVRVGSTGPCASKANITNGTSDADHPFRFYATSSPTASLQEVGADTPIDAGQGVPGDDATVSQIDTVQISLFTQETGAGISNTCESLSARVNLRNLTFQ